MWIFYVYMFVIKMQSDYICDWRNTTIRIIEKIYAPEYVSINIIQVISF